ncbi:transporter [Streptomyces sp. NPDC002920]
MIWLTWRQLRAQAAVTGAALAFLGVLLAVTGPHLADGGDALLGRLTETDQTVYYVVLAAMFVLPAVIGMFWGAPLIARELESGTHRLAWNQSVTRTRWLLTRLSLTGLAAATAAGLASLAVTWWSGPIDRAAAAGGSEGVDPFFPRLHPLVFAARGVVPVGVAVFAFVLGVTLGLLIRRTVPAMATALAVYVGVEFAVPVWIRPQLVPTERTTVPVDGKGPIGVGEDSLRMALDQPGSWITSQETLDASGHVLGSLPSSVTECTPPTPVETCLATLTRQHYRQRITYHPADHFWPLQWAETALYLTLSLALAALCVWWLRRRPA